MIYLPKSQPAPESLEKEKKKKTGSYRELDVLERLKIDFKNKCYICEEKEPTNINVEHFKPHKEKDVDLKFDWNNLFFCCVHCNNTKLAKPIFDNILNCTESDDVEKKISYKVSSFPKEHFLIKPLEDIDIIKNTVELLNQIYNGTTELKTIEAENIRSKILKKINFFYSLLIDYKNNNSNKEKIIQKLSSSSSYTAFKRWIIRENDVLMADFSDNL